MCLVCTDAEDMLDPEDRRNFEMAEPWEALRDVVLATLREGVAAFFVDLKEEADGFLKDVASRVACEKWRSLNADTPEERGVAFSNLRHLKGQVAAEIARLKLAKTRKARDLLERVVVVAVELLVKMAPTMLKL